MRGAAPDERTSAQSAPGPAVAITAAKSLASAYPVAVERRQFLLDPREDRFALRVRPAWTSPTSAHAVPRMSTWRRARTERPRAAPQPDQL